MSRMAVIAAWQPRNLHRG